MKNDKQIKINVDLAQNAEQVELEFELAQNNVQIETGLAQNIIYAFSPTAKIELLDSGNYLIIITDKNGTTTAEIPVIKEQILEELIQSHNLSDEAHENIRQMIQNLSDETIKNDDILIIDCGNANTEY